MISILIIGAGFAGAASAYFLSQIPGLKIRLVDKEAGFGMQASGRNAAMLRQAVSDRQTAEWIQETLAFLQNPPSEFSGVSLFEKTGSLLLGDPHRLHDLFNSLRTVGGRAEWVSPKNLPPQCPAWLQGVFPAAHAGEALFCPDDGVIQLTHFLGGLLSEAETRGVEILYRNEVTKIIPLENSWEVHHDENIFRADGIVNGAGAWCDALIGMAGLPKLNLIPHRRHLFKSEGWKFSNQGLPLVWDVSREVYFRPEENELLFSPGDEDPHPAAEPSVDPQAEQWLREKLGEVFPGMMDPFLIKAWACLRTKSPDGKMHVRQLFEKPGYFCVSGLGGHGVGASIGLGKAIQRLMMYWLQGKKSFKDFG